MGLKQDGQEMAWWKEEVATTLKSRTDLSYRTGGTYRHRQILPVERTPIGKLYAICTCGSFRKVKCRRIVSIAQMPNRSERHTPADPNLSGRRKFTV
jgi:hypothetical protein